MPFDSSEPAGEAVLLMAYWSSHDDWNRYTLVVVVVVVHYFGRAVEHEEQRWVASRYEKLARLRSRGFADRKEESVAALVLGSLFSYPRNQ